MYIQIQIREKKNWSHLLIPKKYDVSSLGVAHQNQWFIKQKHSFKDRFYCFSEEVNAHLEQLNTTIHHNDPVLVAFTLTTDGSRKTTAPT